MHAAGLSNIMDVDEAFKWVTQQGIVRISDSFVNNRENLISGVMKKFGTSRRSSTIIKGNNHFYVVDSNSKEINNSAVLGKPH